MTAETAPRPVLGMLIVAAIVGPFWFLVGVLVGQALP